MNSFKSHFCLRRCLTSLPTKSLDPHLRHDHVVNSNHCVFFAAINLQRSLDTSASLCTNRQWGGMNSTNIELQCSNGVSQRHFAHPENEFCDMTFYLDVIRYVLCVFFIDSDLTSLTFCAAVVGVRWQWVLRFLEKVRLSISPNSSVVFPRPYIITWGCLTRGLSLCSWKVDEGGY